MVSFKSNKSNLNRKNPIFFYLKKNHDLYQPYSPKMLMKEALHTGTRSFFMNPDTLIG